MKELFQFDMHVHTSETSACGRISGRDVAWCYRAAGYQGIMITDHYHKAYFDSLGQMETDQKIEAYLSGYRAAKAEGDRIGLDVVLGIEFRNTETDDDFLIVGITEEFLHRWPSIYELPLEQAIALFHEHDMLVIQAHPVRFAVADNWDWGIQKDFRNREMLEMLKRGKTMERVSFGEWEAAGEKDRRRNYSYPLRLQVCRLRCEDFLDGIEIYNGNFHWAQDPEDVEQILSRHPDYIRTSASDFHEAGHLARGGMVFTRRVRNSGELRQAFLDGCVVDWICR